MKDLVEITEEILTNAGFAVELDGMSFVVSLKNYPVRKQQIDTILYYEDISAKLARVGDSVRVTF